MIVSLAAAASDSNETSVPTPNIHPIPPHYHLDKTNAPSQHHVTDAPHISGPTSFPTMMAPTYVPRDPTTAPTVAPATKKPYSPPPTSGAPTPDLPPVPPPTDKTSILRILGKTIAWCILLALSILLFGACMSHRYRLWSLCRNAAYRLQRLECTRNVWERLQRLDPRARGNNSSYAGSAHHDLNTIIFDASHEMSEGLLMRDSGD
jgi:hypothetical protein